MSSAQTLWPIFVEDGSVYAGALEDGVEALVRAHARGAALPPRRTIAALGDEGQRLATIALLMGVEDVALLALACERGFDAFAAGRVPAEVLLPALAAASHALAAAFRAFTHPDASGARTERDPLDAARSDLERAVGAPRPADPFVRDGSSARVAANAAREAAATAVSAAAAAAASAAVHRIVRESSDAPEVTFETMAPAPPVAAPAPVTPGVEIWTPQVDEDMVELFFDEAHERLEGLAQKLVQLEERPDDAELVRDVFRDLHTLKGSSAMVGLGPMNRLAHAAEDLVGHVRDGVRRADRPLVDALLAGLDALRVIAQAARQRQPIASQHAALLARLRDPAVGAVETPEPAAALAPAATTAAGPPGAGAGAAAVAALGKHTLRVDFDKLDLLMNLVGELVLGKAGLTAGIAGLASLGRELESERRLARRGLAARRAADSGGEDLARGALRRVGEELSRVERVFHEVTQDLDSASGRLDHVAGELREQVMKLRMLPIGGVFRKYHRTVRDLANALGKKARLELVGEDTELDKILVEQLDDPLMHLVRNAVDHGIEMPEKRLAAGKPAEGLVRLRAFHRGNQIVIEIQDDGGGMDPAKLRRKAVEKGLVSAAEAETLDDKETLDLIFRAGFSTAARISEVSGRGVGMDVVRNAIVSRLKGEIDLTSAPGQGSTFTLRLPLTLAIIQVLLARIGGETFAMPLDVVTRTLTCAPADVRKIADREVLAVRDQQVPLVRVRDVLELRVEADLAGEALHVVLVEVLGQTIGLVCERLLGKQEIVIKSLGDLLEEVPCAAGATLLGDRVAIILDVPALVHRAMSGAHQGGRNRRITSEPDTLPGERRPRILLVEDSDVIRESLRRLLQGAGYDVTEARDGQEGLEQAHKAEFDLISTDIMMPRMDGYELTRALRAEGRHRDTPIVMVTSRGEKIDRVRGFDAGVDEYITKPHDRQLLLRAVAKQLGRRHGGEQS
jgi:two-component system chemotaxis sensor kinase CheA